jgi:hypothetical protein
MASRGSPQRQCLRSRSLSQRQCLRSRSLSQRHCLRSRSLSQRQKPLSEAEASLRGRSLSQRQKPFSKVVSGAQAHASAWTPRTSTREPLGRQRIRCGASCDGIRGHQRSSEVISASLWGLVWGLVRDVRKLYSTLAGGPPQRSRRHERPRAPRGRDVPVGKGGAVVST